MRLLTFAVLTFLLSGCAQSDRQSTHSTGPISHQFCSAYNQTTSNGTVNFVLVGCPVTLGHPLLGQDSHAVFAIPQNSTGMRLHLNIDTVSAGTMEISMAANSHRWNLTFVGPYPNNDQLLIRPNHTTSGAFDYYVSVCGIHAAEVTVKTTGTYGASNATLEAFVPNNHLENGTTELATPSCNGRWNGGALVPPQR
jgi:hypothetical protein